MHPGRALGVAMGIVILLSVFLLPFGTLPGISDSSHTLYSAFYGVAANIEAIQDTGDFGTMAAAFMLAVATVLLTLAGVVGLFPLGSSVLALVAIGILTMSPYLSDSLSPQVSWGVGFYVIWGASLTTLAAAFWNRKGSIPLFGTEKVEKS